MNFSDSEMRIGFLTHGNSGGFRLNQLNLLSHPDIQIQQYFLAFFIGKLLVEINGITHINPYQSIGTREIQN